MVTLDDMLAQVDAECAPLHMPAWADPHPDDRQPLEDQYSRVTNPQRYSIVHARARAWATVLERTLNVAAEPWTPALDKPADDRFSRGVRLTSPRPATLPLLLLEADDPLPMLRVSAVDPSWVLSAEPNCGCDACDEGSDRLLQAIDDAIGIFLQGPYVLMRGPGWTSSWCPSGGESSASRSHPSFDVLMATSVRLAAGEPVELPRRAEVAVNQSWLG